MTSQFTVGQFLVRHIHFVYRQDHCFHKTYKYNDRYKKWTYLNISLLVIMFLSWKFYLANKIK